MSGDAPDGNDTYAMGEPLPDFTAGDAWGEDLSLYQFYGSVILLDFSAGWCGPCNDVADDAERDYPPGWRPSLTESGRGARRTPRSG